MVFEFSRSQKIIYACLSRTYHVLVRSTATAILPSPSTLTTIPCNMALLQTKVAMVVIKIATFRLLAALGVVVVKSADWRGIIDR